jgi:hypothetical protein
MIRVRLSVAVVSLFGMTGLGYTWYYTGDANAPEGPDRGVPIRWYVDDVEVRLDSKLSQDVPIDDALAAIRASLATWNCVPCPHPVLLESGFLQDEPAILKRNGTSYGNNLIVFQDKDAWPSGKPLNTLGVIALTTLFYNPKTGQADSYALEMNDGGYTFSTHGSTPCPDGEKSVDIENTMTHELGHVLGLDHTSSDVPFQRDTTMYFRADFCEIDKRDLHVDDIEGLCELYMRDQAEFDRSEPSGGGKCSSGVVARVPGAPVGFLMIAVVMLGAFLILHRLNHSPGRLK